jgi:protein O-GlcNAc transferase
MALAPDNSARMSESLTPAQAQERALALHMAGNLQQAEEIYRLILEAAPDFGPSAMTWGVLRGQVGDYFASEELLLRAARHMPDSADVWSNLGNVQRILEKNSESAESCRRAIALQPNHSFAWSNLSAVLRLTGKIQDSLEAARQALSHSPDFLEARVNEGCALQSLGRMDEALDAFLDLTRSNPTSLYGWSCCLLALQYSDRHSQEEIHSLVRRFWNTQTPPPKQRLPERVRKVGLLSGDFCQHPVGLFCQPLLEGWDHDRHEVHLFSNLAGGDEITESLAGFADGFHSISGVSDQDAESLISRLGIDVLVDLSGHTAKNRMSLLLLKPAPLIASYLGYSASTGIRAVDFLIGDPWVTPPEQERFYTEKVLRLTTSVFCRPLAKPPTLKANGGVQKRLGSFNSPAKISASSLDLWAKLMEAEPNTVLVMKYRGFDDREVQDAFRGQMQQRGVSGERLEFHGWMSRGDHQQLVESLDLHLDTHPYTGATTIADMLEAGIPCPTIAGDRYAGRMGASVLWAAGMEMLVCADSDEWLRICRRCLHDDDFRRIVSDAMSFAPRSAFGSGRELAQSFQDVCAAMPRIAR